MPHFVFPERRSIGRSRPPAIGVLAALALAGWTAGGCEGSARPPDAQARANAESSEISVRFDVDPARETTVQVLAFRATVSAAQDPLRPDVLGTVDPLAAAAPSQGCVVRDVDVAHRQLVARGTSIELEELTGIGIGIGDSSTLLRPSAQIYPDVASVVGGVVAQVGPLPVALLPDRISLFTADTELPVAELAVPAAPRVVSVDGALPSAGMRVETQEAMVATVAGGAGGVLELRPYGATAAVACAIPGAGGAADAVVIVPRSLLAQVVSVPGVNPATSGVAASLEVARRARILYLAGNGIRVSVEARSTTTVELRP